MVQKAFRIHAKVSQNGTLEVLVPLPPGTEVEVLVLAAEEDSLDDLLQAAGSSLDFWNDPEDDEDWNNA